LTIDLDRLLIYRRQRSRHVGMPSGTAYTDPAAVEEELRAAQRVFREGGFPVIDVTDKTVEAGADEIIKRIGSQSRLPAS
jgi:regulator of PEP synthase PpsR (kinase-PPPase family)